MRATLLIIWRLISYKLSVAVLLFSISFYGAAQVQYIENTPIKVGLLDYKTIANNSGAHFNQLNNFVYEYWQLWAFNHKKKVSFVYLAGEDVFPALEQGAIDVVGLTTITGEDPDNLYSIPYAQFKQKIFKHLQGNQKKGIQLAIDSPRTSTLSFLADYVERDYYSDIDEMLLKYKNYDALYSIRPWVLKQKLAELNLAQEFYISSDEAPDIHFHFATRKSDRALMYQVNDGLRKVSKAQALLWSKKYINGDEDNFTFMLGDYIQNLTEAEKQYVLDHNHIIFPSLPTGFPPYIINKSFININERGLTMDILKHATKKTGLIFKNIYVPDLLKGDELLENTVVDFYAVANRFQSGAIEKLFSASYFNSHFSLIFRHDYPIKSSINALDTEVIAAVKGLRVTRFLQKKLPSATIKLFNHIDDAVYAVAKGEANAYVGEALNNAYVIKQAKLSNLTSVPLKNMSFKAEISFASRSDNTRLIALLNRSLNSLSVTDFDNMYAVWSKTAFSNASAKKEVEDVYQKAMMLFVATILIVILIIRFYIRQINFRKTAQHKVEQALAVAEEARTEAERSAQAKIDFLARMSHEIRTPMNGVLGMAESLNFTQLSNNQKSLLSTLTDSAENLMVLLNDILDFAKMDAGKLTLESQPVNLKELAESAIKAVSHAEKEKNIALKLTLDKALSPYYFTDPHRLTQVLNNLMSNAVKFTDQGKVELSVFLVASKLENGNHYDTIKISVKDTGIGIDSQQQKQLFSPFIQADSAVTRKFGGTGLGLSICQEIINAMGSKIHIKCTFEIGSDFYFNLTLKQMSSRANAEERRQLPRDSNTDVDTKFNGIKVLMAEDNIVNIKVLSAQLERLNIHPDIAENGQEALTLFEQSFYDIVISDCHMPIVDGYELANVLSQQKHGNKPWLIAITADALTGTAEKCMSAGFDDYVAKPCTQQAVTDMMHNALRNIQDNSDKKVVHQRWNYQYFKPELLMEHNEQDIVLCKNIAQVFAEAWQVEKLQLIDAVTNEDFHHIFALVHRLKGSIRYLGNDSLECNAILIQKQAHALQIESIQYSIKLFIRELDLLSLELNDWLKPAE